jgi:hypothetical protein
MALTKAQLVDLNSNELILDLDADTSLHSDTDDQIDIKIGGADDFRFTANTFTALAGSGVVIPDGGLTLGSTAVTSTAAELNILDGVTSTATELNIIDGNATVGTTAFADGDGIVTNDNGTMRQTSATTLKTYMADVTLTTAAQTNITSLGTLTALTVDDVAIDGKVVTMTGSSGDTFVTTVAANGATSLVTTDTAAAAANLTITADGTVGINSTGDMTLDSSADIVLDAAGGDLNFKQAGTEILRISNTSTNAVLQNRVDSADIIFKQADGTETLRLDDDTTVKVATDLTVGDDVSLVSDAAVLNFGADSEIKLTHVADTGLLLTDSGGTPTLQFHDANESISSDGGHLIFTSNGVAFDFPSADGSSGQFLKTNGSGVLSFDTVSSAADDLTVGDAAVTLSTSSGNITIDATANDTDIIFKGTDNSSDITMLTLDGSDAGHATFNSAITSGAVITSGAGLVIANAGNIGSASDTDAIAIASNGVVTFSQAPVFPDGSIAVADLDIDGATDIGAAIVDADLFIIDDGAGGTNRKVTASRLKTYISPGSWVKIGSTVVASTNTATVDFDNLSSDYYMYVIIGSQIRPETTNSNLTINFGTDGSTYAANKTSHYWMQYNNEGDSDTQAESSATYSLGNNTGDQVIGYGAHNHGTYGKAGTMRLWLGGLGQGSAYGSFHAQYNYFANNNYNYATNVTGQIQAAADCVRLKFHQDGIAAGNFTLYGITQ